MVQLEASLRASGSRARFAHVVTPLVEAQRAGGRDTVEPVDTPRPVASSASMKARTFMLVALLAWDPLADAQEAIPANFPASRYEAMIQEAPFAVATAAEPVVAAPSFAAELYVTGVARIGDNDLVTLSSRDKTKHFSLSSGEAGPNTEGIEIVQVDWSDSIGGTKVSVKKAGEFATLEFDRAELAMPLAPQHANPTSIPSHEDGELPKEKKGKKKGKKK